MSNIINGVVVSYRRGPKTQRTNECLLNFYNVKSISEASKLIGYKVTLLMKKRKIVGKIVSSHGKNGLVRARFKKGLSGESLQSFVQIKS